MPSRAERGRATASSDRGSRGLFVTFEGPEGSGKTTQVARLAVRLKNAGYRVTAVREPGGTPAGERIREVLLDPHGPALHPETEAFLFCAARSELVAEVIVPGLAGGDVVLCDRYADATLAYQGFGSAMPLAPLRRMNEMATKGLRPALTLLLDLPVEEGLQRRRAGAEWTRLDAAGMGYHARVRRGYLKLAAAEPGRWVVLDARPEPDAVAEAVWHAVRRRLPPPAVVGPATASPA